jgi:hypothetical protein
MEAPRLTPVGVIVKTLVTHTVTYFLLGVASFALLDYSAAYAGAAVNQFMRQTSDRIVMAGPLFQPIRGLLFGVVLYLLREPFFQRRRGWLLLWLTLVVVGIVATFGAAPGSIEGVVYTTLPLSFHLRGLPEILVQTLLFSFTLSYWINHPEKRWLTWVLGVLFVLVLVFPALGLLAA